MTYINTDDLMSERLQYIMPKYTNQGDSTHIYTFSKKEFSIPKTMRSVLKKIYFFQTIDRIALKNKMRELGIYQNEPIIIKGEVFVKAKVRRPIGKSDGAYGYVNISAIKHLVEEEDFLYIELQDGSRLKIIDRIETISKNIFIAKNVVGILIRKDPILPN